MIVRSVTTNLLNTDSLNVMFYVLAIVIKVVSVRFRNVTNG